MNPMEMGLVQCLTHSYLYTSFDELIQLEIDGLTENVPLEFKRFLPMIVGMIHSQLQLILVNSRYVSLEIVYLKVQ